MVYPVFYPNPDGVYESVLEHCLQLRSTAACLLGREIFPTSLISNEIETVDYLWVNGLEPVSMVLAPHPKIVEKLSGLPNEMYPSDHLPLVADYDFK